MSAAIAEPGDGDRKLGPIRPPAPLSPEQEAEFEGLIAGFRAMDREFEIVVRDGFLGVPEDGVLIALPDMIAVAPTDEGYASFLMRNGQHVDARVSSTRVLEALGLTGGANK